MKLALTIAALVLSCGGCASVQDGPVTITRTLNVGIYHSCLSAGIGVMLCEHIRFDPKTCALVIIYPKPPSPGVKGVLNRLAHQTRAECLKENTP